MQNLLRFLDRQGKYKEMHIISVHYSLDIDSEEIVVELAGIDDSAIISLDNETSQRLIHELMRGRQAVDQSRTRKKRTLKEKGILTDSDILSLSNHDIDQLYKGTIFDKKD